MSFFKADRSRRQDPCATLPRTPGWRVPQQRGAELWTGRWSWQWGGRQHTVGSRTNNQALAPGPVSVLWTEENVARGGRTLVPMGSLSRRRIL